MTTNKPELCRSQPCGCVVCICEHETKCTGCGAKHCGTHPVGQIPGPVYQQPAPDVAGLVEELEVLLVSGHLPRTWKERLSILLAAYRKGGDA